MQTKIRVKVKVKRFSKKQFILHLLLQPCTHDFDEIVRDVRLKFNIELDEAENCVQRWKNYVDEWGLSYKERDMFSCPISVSVSLNWRATGKALLQILTIKEYRGCKCPGKFFLRNVLKGIDK